MDLKWKKSVLGCGKYPLCDRCESPTGYCEDWIKKPKQLKLESKNGLNFNFKEV